MLKRLLVLSIILSSCSFNKMFMYPVPLSTDDYRVYTRDGKTSYRVFFNGDSLQPTFLNAENDTIGFDFTIESVLFQSKNGNTINGWMLKETDREPKATILHLHGNAANLVHQFGAIDKLCLQGYQVFLFDYSGFGFSTGKATQKNVKTDAQSALEYVLSRPDCKNLPLIVYGQSLGGHLAAEIGQLNQVKIDGLVIEGAFSSHRDIASYTMKKSLHMGFLGRIFVRSRYKAKKSIEKFKKPLLVIHSREDETIPFFMGERIYDHANQPKELFAIDGCHICGPDLYPREIGQKIEQMLKKEP